MQSNNRNQNESKPPMSQEDYEALLLVETLHDMAINHDYRGLMQFKDAHAGHASSAFISWINTLIALSKLGAHNKTAMQSIENAFTPDRLLTAFSPDQAR
ncbi:hypothetical protein FEZ41_02650 [Lentilactobacillus parafarraginis]|uniref:Uncharacterized protein n=2 Tax=Lentilactobacillus parafarraginis TaxID=390842 RepID=A0A0R1YZ23_9LACO|nr:hypothetical protein [Lentilactobacillus parafarraginis]KRM44827.1 hypothetical protein FD47_GL002934 [Lentilactobacillus parafarraginis DSM 18390 = JCM 14109]TLQ20634.1 hypothetical protein FEZ41_02650 [Lentilactobacillus parafarraginis]